MSETMCSETVWKRDGNWGRNVPCARKGVVERDGKHYCRQHDPEAIKARREATSAKWNAEWDAKKKQSQRQYDCLAAFEGVENPQEALKSLLTAARNFNEDRTQTFEDFDQIRAALSAFPKGGENNGAS